MAGTPRAPLSTAGPAPGAMALPAISTLLKISLYLNIRWKD